MKEKILIAYYTRSGNTKKIAENIQKIVGGDLFEIKCVEPYSEAYRKALSQAKKQINNDEFPEIKAFHGNIEIYDKIFVGTPNWCNTMAPPVKAFLRQNNFRNQKIVPFCTHGGGGSGHIFDDMKKEASEIAINEGLSIYDDGGSSRYNTVKQYLDKTII